MVHTEVSRVRRGEEVGKGRGGSNGTPGAEGHRDCGTGGLAEESRWRGGAGSQVGEGIWESPGVEEVKERTADRLGESAGMRRTEKEGTQAVTRIPGKGVRGA